MRSFFCASIWTKPTTVDCAIALINIEGRLFLESPQALTLEKLAPKFDSIARCIQRIESKKPLS